MEIELLFVGYDPGEEQYFVDINVPENTIIPCGDPSAYVTYPKHNWVYNKIELCKTQDIPQYPHGVPPHHFPVISKPITNLYGMSQGVRKLYTWDSELDYKPGHFCMPFYTGIHLSTDFVVIDGSSKWNHTFIGHKDMCGKFLYWESVFDHYESILELFRLWIYKNLPEYTGIVNIESINNKIIECHLRMSPQFIDLYGNNWLESVIDLYHKQKWNFEQYKQKGFSVLLWSNQPGVYKLNQDEIDKLRKKTSSIQIAVDTDVEISEKIYHNKTFRLAVVNDFDLQNAKNICEQLTEHIILT